MTWQENVQQWKALPEARKTRIRWDAIALDVAESMAFEREPVPVERIRETLAILKQPG